MPKYVAAYERDVSVYGTRNGSIAIESVEHVTEESVKILLSIRQAKMILEDLPEVIKSAQIDFLDYVESEGRIIGEVGDAEPSNP